MSNQIEEPVTKRYNSGKTKLELIPAEWLEVLGRIFTFGAVKYMPWNWTLSLNGPDHDQLIEDRLGSMLRHYTAYRKGEKYDPESGEHHLGHVAWSALLVVWYDLKDKRND